jgi:hypothetical protein
MGLFKKKPEIKNENHNETIHIINKEMNTLMTPEKACFITGGGLGDILFQCLSEDSDVSLAQSYISKRFNVYSKMLCI